MGNITTHHQHTYRRKPIFGKRSRSPTNAHSPYKNSPFYNKRNRVYLPAEDICAVVKDSSQYPSTCHYNNRIIGPFQRKCNSRSPFLRNSLYHQPGHQFGSGNRPMARSFMPSVNQNNHDAHHPPAYRKSMAKSTLLPRRPHQDRSPKSFCHHSDHVDPHAPCKARKSMKHTRKLNRPEEANLFQSFGGHQENSNSYQCAQQPPYQSAHYPHLSQFYESPSILSPKNDYNFSESPNNRHCNTTVCNQPKQYPFNIHEDYIMTERRSRNQQLHEQSYYLQEENKYKCESIMKKIRNFNDFLNEIKSRLKSDQQYYHNCASYQSDESKSVSMVLKLENQRFELEKYKRMIERELSKQHSIDSIQIKQRTPKEQIIEIHYENKQTTNHAHNKPRTRGNQDQKNLKLHQRPHKRGNLQNVKIQDEQHLEGNTDRKLTSKSRENQLKPASAHPSEPNESLQVKQHNLSERVGNINILMNRVEDLQKKYIQKRSAQSSSISKLAEEDSREYQTKLSPGKRINSSNASSEEIDGPAINNNLIH